MPDSPELVRAKATLRTPLLAGRAGRTAQARAGAADALADVLAAHLPADGVVAATVPLAEEPGHGRLPAALPGRVLLPVVPAQGRQLHWGWWSGALTVGRFGLLEPPGTPLPPATLAAADVVLVPALAVAADGTRLGRGGGWYDRALPHARPDALLVAVVFDEEMVDELPSGEHDHRVSAVVTPGGGWRPLR
ncbi:5-formyltetrahydrofolate cyclo-ligase [Modestobacter italicus]|uniref:5-formyltetrahydrofolate cyclo-ligase n=1 Tax=Modestobacter italicus (strain DSM 44449 / CECT 9708 / BC 501) TaxID=2732864 RepID=UPI001C957333|nr:5-formyltetrahydrofolate cyclo-ligase [Modestobacter italicus]